MCNNDSNHNIHMTSNAYLFATYVTIEKIFLNSLLKVLCIAKSNEYVTKMYIHVHCIWRKSSDFLNRLTRFYVIVFITKINTVSRHAVCYNSTLLVKQISALKMQFFFWLHHYSLNL